MYTLLYISVKNTYIVLYPAKKFSAWGKDASFFFSAVCSSLCSHQNESNEQCLVSFDRGYLVMTEGKLCNGFFIPSSPLHSRATGPADSEIELNTSLRIVVLRLLLFLTHFFVLLQRFVYIYFFPLRIYFVSNVLMCTGMCTFVLFFRGSFSWYNNNKKVWASD